MAEPILVTKNCRKCLICKSLTEYHAHQSTRDRLYPTCKECRKVEYKFSIKKPCNRPRSTESRRADKKAYYIKNREVAIERGLKWARDNPSKASAKAMARLALKRMAAPVWANPVKILEIYKEAEIRRAETGTVWHVDHVVPLKSKFVCGLHVEHNLAVISASDNIAKGNHYWPDMP